MPETKGGTVRQRPGPKPDPNRMVTSAFVFRRDQLAMIAAHAAEAGLSRSEWIRRVLDEYADDC